MLLLFTQLLIHMSEFSGVTGASLRFPTSRSLIPASGGELVDRDHEASMVVQRQFARFIARVDRNASQYASSTLFAESILAQASAQLPQTSELRASVGVWALRLLAKESPVLSTISDLIMPAIYKSFSEEGLIANVPSGTRALLGERADALALLCPNFSHAFYREVCLGTEALLAEAESRSIALNEMGRGRLAIASRLVNSRSQELLRGHFLAWRHMHREARVARFANKVRERRNAGGQRRALLALAFSSWRWVLEQSKGVFLQERLHDNAFLLDNAKNQFQMQCFRSDRYLHTVEELRGALQDMREGRDMFRGEARALEKALRDHRIISRDEKNDIANTLLRTLSEWKHVATVAVTRRSIPVRLIQLEATVSQLRSKKRPVPNSGVVAPVVSHSSDEALDEVSRMSAIAERTCLEWANIILQDSPLYTGSLLTNYSDDFSSGEVFLLLLKEIFPEEIPLTPLQEINLMRRLDKISEFAASVGLCHFPQPSDLMEKSSDIVFMAVAELFLTHTNRILSQVPAVTEPPACLIRYDAGMVRSALRDVSQGMAHIVSTERDIVEDLARIRTMVSGVSQYASFLTRERLAGHPVALVDQKEVNRFCRFKQDRFRDLEFKYKNTGAEWSDQLARLRVEIRNVFPLLKRCFESYAGGGSCITEPNFWRFIGDLGVVDKSTPRAAIERIFTVANREDDAIYESQSDDDNASDDMENPITELIPIEFTECVIRIADQRSQGRALSERVSVFINGFLRPLGARRSDTNRFRREVFDRPSQPIWSKYQKDLAKVFMYFARLSRTGGQRSQSRFISVSELIHICKDGGAIQGSIDESTIVLISRNVLGDEGGAIPLHGFMECLAALAAFRVPSPFIPLDKKIDHVVSQLLANLRIKLRGAVSISDVKTVALPVQRPTAGP